jgi:hypothetical protein
MDMYAITDQISEIWSKSGKVDLVNELNDYWIRGGATGGEVLSRVCGFLKRLKSSNVDAYNDIKELADEYIAMGERHLHQGLG